MKDPRILIVCTATGLLLSCQAPQQTTNTAPANQNTAPSSTPTQKKSPTDMEQLAQRLVNQSAGVKENDIVQISGGVRDIELLENIAINVRKLGAFPFITVDSDRMTKRSFTDVREKFDTQTSLLGMKLAETVKVVINLDSNETEGLLADIPRARLAARGKAGEAIGKQFRKKNVRTIDVGNGLYPTEWRAKQFDMSLDDLLKTFWEGVNIDYTSLQAKAEQV